jgi:hypothetical protein
MMILNPSVDNFEISTSVCQPSVCDHCLLDNPQLATKVCQDCLVKLCQIHSQNHAITRLTAKHKLLSQEEWESLPEFGGLQLKMNQNRQIIMYEETCKQHSPNIANKICVECQMVVCQDCLFSNDHVNHTFKLASDFIPNLISKFEVNQYDVGCKTLSSLIAQREQVINWDKQLEDEHIRNLTELDIEKAMAEEVIARKTEESIAAIKKEMEDSKILLDNQICESM